jgi:hypothetical protein
MSYRSENGHSAAPNQDAVPRRAAPAELALPNQNAGAVLPSATEGQAYAILHCTVLTGDLETESV